MNLNTHNYSFRNHSFNETKRLFATGNPVGEAPCLLTEDFEVVLPASDSRLARYYAADLSRFLNSAFGLALRIRFAEEIAPHLASPQRKILLLAEADAPALAVDSPMKGAFRILVTEDAVLIVGKTERGTAQGVYYLEDAMRLAGLPALAREEGVHAPLFSPRMTHSGTELDTFPDSYLEAVAHAGMDAIIVYAGHPDSHLHGFPDPDALWPGTGRGYCDFANLVWRAAGFGLDVYVYSQMICDKAPDDPEAYAYYDASFGRLFREAPGLRGLILVGESFEFPSKDPHTCGTRVQKRPKGDTRPSSGRYPSCDYPEMLSLVRDVCRAYTPDADIVFWSYNFGWTPKEARCALIERLPRDISYLVTFEVWERLLDEEGRRYNVADYSIAYPGPARIFCEEAEKAKECGLRLYTMGNTGGRTWDSGGAPYIPTPSQWQKRYEAIRKAQRDYGLVGLMENHHYGWLPSFLTLFAKNAFTTGGRSDEEMLRAIAVRDFGGEADRAMRGFALLDEGMSRVIPAMIDQYGPYRCGPTYPLLFTQTAAELRIPKKPWAWHPAGGIWRPVYPDEIFGDVDNTLLRLSRVRAAADRFGEGLALLETAARFAGVLSDGEASSIVAVTRYLYCSWVTARHVMEFNIAKRLLLWEGEATPPREEELLSAIGLTARDGAGLAALLRRIIEAERENVALALTSWEADSSIGFEASMEYVFDHENAAWKLSELDRTLALLDDYMKN